MGHLTRYLLKKAFQLFCFYPNCPKRLARLETVWCRATSERAYCTFLLQNRKKILPLVAQVGEF